MVCISMLTFTCYTVWVFVLQLTDEPQLQASLVEELRKALVQSFELELQFVRHERDSAVSRADSLQRQVAELPVAREEVKRLREQLAMAQGTIEALRVEQSNMAAVIRRAEDEAAARVKEAAAAVAAATVAQAATVPATSGTDLTSALVPTGGSRRPSVTTLDADQEFMNADADHDGAFRAHTLPP